MVPLDTPSVLVLLVATDGARWLPDVLRGLRAQRYRPLRVVAVDNASSDESGAILAKAFGASRVVTLDRRVGYGRALAAGLKSAAERRLDADAFLVLHDDCMLAKDAIGSLVEQLRDDVGIVGAKLVDWDDPGLLQDIGQTTDRYGRVVPRVERGELDQGQHDGIHDVLYASSAAMLVSRTMVEQIGLFDLRYVAMRDDLDLCWRARMAGFRTVVATDAVGKHVAAVARDLRVSPVRGRTRYFGERNVISTLIKNYSIPRLLFALPATMAASLINAILFLVSGRRRPALQVLEALQWNIVHLPSTLRARARVQRTRKVGDKVVTAMMHHGATRLRSQFERAVEKVIGDVEEGSDEDLDKPPPTLFERARAHPTATLILFALVIGFLGARTAFFPEPMAGADFGPFPAGPSGFFRAYASGWRGAGSGGAGPATPGLALLGMLSTFTFTSGWLAQRLLILALPLVGAVTMHRLAGATGLSAGPRRVAVILFVLSPLMLHVFGSGRLGDLVLLAAAPGLLVPLLRAASLAPRGGWRSAATGTIGTAFAASLAPWTLVFVAGAALAIAATAAAGPKPVAPAVLRRAAAMLGGALLLLFPWSLELFKRGTPLWSGPAESPSTMAELLALSPGGATIVPIAIGVAAIAAGAAGLWMAPEPHRRLAATASVLGAVSLVLAYLVSRGISGIAPRSGLVLTGTAVCAALLAGVGYSSVGARLTTRTFGLTHLVLGIVGVGVLALSAWGSAWIAGGSRPGWVVGDELLPSFIEREADRDGPFRVAWLSGSSDDVSLALTGPAGTTMTSYLERPAGAGAAAARRAAMLMTGGGDESGGRALATLGVRYVVVRRGSDDSLAEQIGRDPDLVFLQRSRGSLVYRNASDLFSSSFVRSPGWVSAAGGRIGDATLGETAVERSPLRRRTTTGFRGRVAGPGAILLAEDFDDGWRAQVGERTFAPARSFGWATKFDIPKGVSGTARVTWRGQRWHRLALLLQALIVFAFLIGWSQRAARERGER